MKRKNPAGGNVVLLALALILVLVFLASFSLGRYGIPIIQVIKILFHPLFGYEQSWTDAMETVVWNIRMPRILLACLVGCCLSAAGASYQGVFQNPMASPDILGASNGAAFGAALSILLGASMMGVAGGAFAMSMISMAVVLLIASKAKGNRIVGLILAGIMVGSLFSAGTSYIKLVADPSNELPQITYWLMGSLSGARMNQVLMVMIPMAIGLVPLLLLRWRINLLTLGEDEARALGVNTSLLRLTVIACSTLITASSVAVSGMIGWVGLVIPHLLRRIVGSDYRYLLPASCMGGAIFLLLVDDVSRNLLAVEIPIGILTVFIGAPFFIYLLCRKEKML
jgi:iron complex transport system permease protein